MFGLTFAEQFVVLSSLSGIQDEARLVLIKRIETFLNCQQLLKLTEVVDKQQRMFDQQNEMNAKLEKLEEIKKEVKEIEARISEKFEKIVGEK